MQNLKPGNTSCRGKLTTLDLLIEILCFVKKELIMFGIPKTADLNWLAQEC